MELPALGPAQRPEQVGLGAPGRHASPLDGSPAVNGQLHAMAAPVRRIRRPRQKVALLELIEQGDQVARLDPQRLRQIALGDGPLRIEMVEDRELGPPQAAIAKASPKPPG
jgi:hypothetical protein